VDGDCEGLFCSDDDEELLAAGDDVIGQVALQEFKVLDKEWG
jgi:hypothetical protein